MALGATTGKTSASLAPVVYAQQLARQIKQGYIPQAIVQISRQVRRETGGAGIQRLQESVNKVRTMQAAVGAFQSTVNVIEQGTFSGEPNAFAAAIVRYSKPTILGLVGAQILAGGQQQQLQQALDKLEAHYTDKTTPTAIQQAMDLLAAAAIKIGKMLTFVLACGVILSLALSGSSIGVVISIGLYFQLMKTLWETFLNTSTWVAQTLATIMLESARVVLSTIGKTAEMLLQPTHLLVPILVHLCVQFVKPFFQNQCCWTSLDLTPPSIGIKP